MAQLSYPHMTTRFPGGSDGKESGDLGSILGLGRSPGGGHGNPLQYSCLEKSMDRGAWSATVHGVAKSQTRLKQPSMQSTLGDRVLLSRGNRDKRVDLRRGGNMRVSREGRYPSDLRGQDLSKAERQQATQTQIPHLCMGFSL